MSAESDGKKLRVSIVEDDNEIRAHLAQLIAKARWFSLVSDHGVASEAIPAILKEAPEIVLMDINLPGMNGIECTRILKQKLPAMQILMLTVFEDSELIFESLKAGASGYLLKRTPSAKLLEALQEVHQGGSPMSSSIARRVVQYFKDDRKRAPEIDQLTDRERAVLGSLARGQLYKEIAEALGMSIDTVRKHLQSIYHKLHVHTRTEAVVKYLGN
ncbi:MAG: response regulator transcription factor [Limisphaerales bacterium]